MARCGSAYSCPACGAEVAERRLICACGADLGLLARLDAVADAWFNEALASLAAGAPGRALEWLSACCAARPADAAARRVQAKLWARFGHWREAHDSLDRAAAVDPDAADLQAIREAVNELERASSRAETSSRPEAAGCGGDRPPGGGRSRRARARKPRA
jgi:tetratricopeptide (TPR) repeat protein